MNQSQKWNDNLESETEGAFALFICKSQLAFFFYFNPAYREFYMKSASLVDFVSSTNDKLGTTIEI